MALNLRPVRFINYARDTLTSLVSGLGTGRDKSATTFYTLPAVDPATLSTMYRASWLARKIVTIPALDATRKWRNWQADYEVIEKIETTERRLDVQRKVLAAKIRARLFGFAALYIGTGLGKSWMPLDPERLGLDGIKFLNLLGRNDLQPGDIDRDPESEFYGTPAWYELQTRGATAVPLRIHPSRLIVFVGEPVPDDEQLPALGTSGSDSVLTSILEAIKQADSVTANTASLVYEAKIDVIRVPDLMASLTDPEYEGRLLNRFSLAATAKGINGTLLLDKEEEYEVKSPSFGTLPQLVMTFMEIVAGAADIPVTRLLGQSPSGLNSTGEGDMRNYYDRISSLQELELTPAMATFDECLIRSATGARDESIYYTWAPLWQITEKERADIGQIDANTIKTLNDTGLFPQEALAKAAVNRLTEDAILPGFDDAIEEAGGSPDYEAEAEEEMRRAIEIAQGKGPPSDNGKDDEEQQAA